jgi:ATP-dependent helicase/nuclease subunit A
MSAAAGEGMSDLERTQAAQLDAADPVASAWVSANAGTGKTHVLTLRVLRLMLADTVPERILCLTYTKAAAAEMSKRVFDTLARWVTMDDAQLLAELRKLGLPAPGPQDLERARTLFTIAIETPGGLKVQTVHSFCERLLQRFPLEAGVAPGFSILDEATAHLLLREAIDETLDLAARETASAEGKALKAVVRFAADQRFDDVLRGALGQRAWLEIALRLADEGVLETFYRNELGVVPDVSEDDLTVELAGVLTDGDLARLQAALEDGSKSDVELAARVRRARTATTQETRIAALHSYLCTDESKPRARLMTKKVRDEHPDLDTLALDAQDRFCRLNEQRKGVAAIEATLALNCLAGAVLDRYSRAKAARAALDYEDLIVRTVHLLRDKQATAWVLYKLDRGIDHILVDEAQDTSPEQWQLIEALAEEFFTGDGQREVARTLFAVGDEKQSIYSFQGAAPRMFAEMGNRFAALLKVATRPWRQIPLDLSFRSVAPVLQAVDKVFADPSRAPGLSATDAIIRHAVHRKGHAGLIEIWPTITLDGGTAADAWSPLEDAGQPAAETRLADRIADTIRHWLDSGERLASEDRPIRPGDILILVRKRRPFAAPMVAALKARGIPVAGADRLRLTEQIAVEDLMSLGDFLTLPEDDLALAEVLKSPLIGLSDDDLMSFSIGRKGSLWKALIDAAPASPHLKTAVDTLKRWRSRADYAPPFEFFAAILDRDGARARFLARLGAEAADPLDEFLNLALSYDDAAPPSLTGFLAYLRETEREVKRDMEHGRDEVRVMTVHGAKGLEAPVVFLPDTCTTAGMKGTVLTFEADALPEGIDADPFVWEIKGAGILPAIKDARDERSAREAEERNRLLYVAMTRARDRLYIAGFEGIKPRAKGCWYDLIFEALHPMLTAVTVADGSEVYRLTEPQTAPAAKPRHALLEADAAVALPDWALRGAPREPSLSIPLAPSRLEAYAPDETGEPLPEETPRDVERREPAMFPPGAQHNQDRFLRGTVTHALLQHLPTLPQTGWVQAARGFVASRAQALTLEVQRQIVTETLAILSDQSFAPLFGPQSRAEVPIVAKLANPRPKGAAVSLVGQIDRLVDLGAEVLLVDYKTNRPPPREVSDVAPAYLYQLAAYRLALGQIYPGRTVKAALLWTAEPRIMMVPAAVLDEYAARLWDLDALHLDAGEGRS